jgi:peptidoglycan/LPS O-acetylase OafA/YrhL
MMTTSAKSLVGKGRFQWNAGSWFGSSLGCSAWMIVAACFLVFHNQQTLALVPATAFVIFLFASLLLWARRDRIRPFPALMMLLGLLAIATPFVLIAVPTYGPRDVLAAMKWPSSKWPTVLGCALSPGIMVWFLFLERSVSTTENEDKCKSTIVA